MLDTFTSEVTEGSALPCILCIFLGAVSVTDAQDRVEFEAQI